MPDSYNFCISGVEPIPKQSVKYNSKTKTYYPDPAGAAYVKTLRLLIRAKFNREKWKKIGSGRSIRITIDFFRSNKRRCDIDNLIKPALDAMKGIVFHDDDQIVEIYVIKQVNETPGIYISVSEIKKKPGD